MSQFKKFADESTIKTSGLPARSALLQSLLSRAPKILAGSRREALLVSPVSFVLTACGGESNTTSEIDHSDSLPVYNPEQPSATSPNEETEKVVLSSLVTNDGSTEDKLGIATSARGVHGSVSVLNTQSSSVFGIDDFRSDARFAGVDGAGLTVAVLDTGIDLDNSSFGADSDNNGIADRIIFSRDFTSERDGTPNDIHGHGTHVASIIGSSSQVTTGIAPGVNLAVLQVLDSTGSGTTSALERALQWVMQNAEAMNIVAVNMSLGDRTNQNFLASHPIYGDELRALHDNLNVSVIVAAGNEYQIYQTEGASSLAVDPNVVAVGAVGGTVASEDDVARFSQRSDDIPTFFAPGEAILGAQAGGGTVALSGTSMAAPHVSGLIALAQQISQRELDRLLTPAELADIFRQSGILFVDDENSNDRVINTGSSYLRLDAVSLGEAVLALSTDAAPEPSPSPLNDIPGSILTDATVTVNSHHFSAIDFGGDQDFFRVSLTPGEYEFTVRGASSGDGSLIDPTLTVLSSSGAFVAGDDDSGLGLDALLNFTVSNSATFFLSVGAYGNGTGTYNLSVNQLSNGSRDIGDTATTAGRLNVGESITNEIEFFGDRDWFSIDLVNGVRYQFELIGVTLSDPYLTLFNENGNVVASDDDGGIGLNSNLEFLASRTGTYYLSAQGFLSSDTGQYVIEAAQEGQILDDYEDGTNTSGALVADGGSISGSLESLGDRDWFRLDLDAGSTYEFQLVGTGNAGSLADPVLYLFDARGNLLGTNDDCQTSLDSLLVFNAQNSGTHFLAAAAYADNYTGQYILSSTLLSEASNDIPGDPSSTSTIEVGQNIAGTIDGPGDSDWYGVNTVAGQIYQFSLISAGANPLLDPWLTLYDSAGNFIDFNDDDGSGRNSYLEYLAAVDARIFVSAEAFDLSADVGTYELSLNIPEILMPDIPGDLTTQATLELGEIASGTINIPGDVDWYRVQLLAGHTYEFTMNAAGDDPMDDPWLGLYNYLGRLINSDDDSGQGTNSHLEYTATSDQLVYLSAEAYNSYTDFGTYEIGVALIDLGGDIRDDDTTGGIVRETEPNDENADRLTSGVAMRGQTSSYSDDDWFYLNLGSAGTITVSFNDGNGSDYSDHDVSIVDAGGNILAEKSIYSSDTVTAEVSAAGVYYVLVNNSFDTAEYSLTADFFTS